MRSIVSTAPEAIRDDMRNLPIAALLERAAAFRPAGRTDVLGATKIALQMLAHRARALAEEIRPLDVLVEKLPPSCSPGPASAARSPERCSSPQATTPNDSDPKRASPTSAVSHSSTLRPASDNVTDSTEVATAKPTAPSGASS